MAQTSAIDKLLEEHEETIEYLKERRGNMLIIDFANNIMVTYDYNDGSWKDAMEYFTKYQSDMNDNFAFIPALKLGEALRNLKGCAKGILAVKAIMRSHIQVRQSHDNLLDIISNLASGNKDIARLPPFESKNLRSAEFDFHRKHIEEWIDPRMKAIVRAHGGPTKSWEAGNLKLIKAGRDDRLELWYKMFNQFPTVICKHIFAATADILPFEYIWACPEPDDTITAYRKALEYLFGELCEESFFFCSFSEAESKGAQSPIRIDRTNNFKSMCDTTYYRSLGLPKNFREYLVKDPASWPTNRKMEVNNTNNPKKKKSVSVSDKSKRSNKEEAERESKRRKLT